MTSPRRSAKLQLRRSISEQLRDSTSKAWDLLWRNVREKRLAGEAAKTSRKAISFEWGELEAYPKLHVWKLIVVCLTPGMNARHVRVVVAVICELKKT